MKKFIWYWLAVIILIILFPLTFHFLIYVLFSVRASLYELLSLGGGILLSALLIRYTSILQVIYIFFHELTHALFVLISQGRIYQIRIQSSFGFVQTDKNNIFIRLSPYFFPLLPFLLMAVYYTALIMLKFNTRVETETFRWISLGIFAMFFTSTTWYNFKLLKKETTDIDGKQAFLSFAFIFTAVIVSTALMTLLLFQQEKILEYIYFL